MKKLYFHPEAKVKDLFLERNFMQSATLGGSTGEDLDTPEDFNPWN